MALIKPIEWWRRTAARYEDEPDKGEGRKQLSERAKQAELKRDIRSQEEFKKPGHGERVMKHHAYLAEVAFCSLDLHSSETECRQGGSAGCHPASVTVDTLRERVAPQGDFVSVSAVGQVWLACGVI